MDCDKLTEEVVRMGTDVEGSIMPEVAVGLSYLMRQPRLLDIQEYSELLLSHLSPVISHHFR